MITFWRSFDWWRHWPHWDPLWRHNEGSKLGPNFDIPFWWSDIVIWYIKWKVWFQRFRIWKYFWSMTSSRDVIKEKPLNIAVIGHLSKNSYTTIVIWYIIWKVIIQRFQILLCFWSVTSSHDVIKEKLSNIALLDDRSYKSFITTVVWYIKWNVFIQRFQIFSNF